MDAGSRESLDRALAEVAVACADPDSGAPHRPGPLLHILQQARLELKVVEASASAAESRLPAAAHAADAAEMVRDACRDKLYEGHFSTVPVIWRKLYSLACLLEAHARLAAPDRDSLMAAIRTCDLGLVMGAPLAGHPLTTLASTIHARLVQAAHTSAAAPSAADSCSPPSPSPGQKRPASRAAAEAKRSARALAARTERAPSPPPRPAALPQSHFRPLQRRHAPPLLNFQQEYMDALRPVVLTGILEHWPALERWNSFDYLRDKIGYRTVPVELGSKYTDEDWGQRLMTVQELLAHFELPSTGGPPAPVLYLAQHQLFEQTPELRRDFVTPDYCMLGAGEVLQINSWLGPAGTVSPLHTDPHHNLLAQVVGYKYVRLYAADQGPRMYAHDDWLLSNTSRVDAEQPQLPTFPAFREAEGFECVLGPGDTLYIPPGVWHFVRSLSASFSVSFWWR